MAKLLKLRRGTTSQHSSFTGAEGEVTVDTTKDTAVVHDGSQAGGRPLLREDLGNIGTGTVTHAMLAGDCIDGDNLADNAVDSEHYTDGSIDTDHIQDLNVTTAKIAADAITGAKIADDAIDSEHYANGSIDTDHIGDNQVTLAKLAGIARGKIIYGDASGDPAVLTVGSSGQTLVSDGTDISWGTGAAGATGGGNDTVFWENGQTVTTNYTITNNTNAGSFGPITINSGAIVVVGSGEVWTVI
tara:strand:- start:802 stop:1533 length:732 start_codon:yes stop_codon:yes gene_type:complete